MKTSFETRFFAGDYGGLVRDFVDSGSLDRFDEAERAFLIGALVFVGRRHDAKAEFAAHLRAGSLESRTIARFFLGVGACRDAEYEEARQLFSENFRTRDELQSPAARFFAIQGLGFFRFFCSRFAKSVLWSKRAWQIAFASRFHYGMILSADLRAHSLMQTGRVPEGLHVFSKALEFSEAGVKEALEISVLIYRAQYGLLPQASTELLKRWKSTPVNDTYSRSNLLLEMVRALILEGRTTAAHAKLSEFANDILKYGQRRQKATYFARRGHALFLMGRVEEAKVSLEEGLRLLDPEVDLAHNLELRGLMARITGQNGSLAELRRRTGRLHPSGDLLGETISRLRMDPKNVDVLLQIERKGWLGLLNRVIERESGLVFYLDLLPGRLVIFHEGNVRISKGQVTGLLKRLLVILSQGPADKTKLVETVWGYKYNSLRHDPMLYNTIYRLRQLLGVYEKFLEAGETGYTWSLQTAGRVFERPVHKAATSSVTERNLTLRQHRALQIVKRDFSISVSTYAKALKVAKATATRDLADLVDRGYLDKTGRARATNYVMKGTL